MMREIVLGFITCAVIFIVIFGIAYIGKRSGYFPDECAAQGMKGYGGLYGVVCIDDDGRLWGVKRGSP